jgi:hypothetical protein
MPTMAKGDKSSPGKAKAAGLDKPEQGSKDKDAKQKAIQEKQEALAMSVRNKVDALSDDLTKANEW